MTSPACSVRLRAPSRLHFGLLSLAGPGRRFGGAGAMIDRPSIELSVARADRFQAKGPLGRRVTEFARSWADHHGRRELPDCRIEVVAVPDQHTGLGVGTQLGLSVAVGLNAVHGLAQPGPLELASSVGRGMRSAVGTYGFLRGGLIVERGKSDERLAPLDCRVALPRCWRFVLVRPTGGQGLHGVAERRAFGEMPRADQQVAGGLARELREHLIPAALAEDFDAFSDSLYRYGRDSGKCFARVQGGAYNGPELTGIVELIRRAGVSGVGQSSWGPTLYALVETAEAGRELVGFLREQLADRPVQLDVSAPNDSGVVLRHADERLTAARGIRVF